MEKQLISILLIISDNRLILTTGTVQFDDSRLILKMAMQCIWFLVLFGSFSVNQKPVKKRFFSATNAPCHAMHYYRL